MFAETEGWHRLKAEIIRSQRRVTLSLQSGNYESLADYKRDAGRYQGMEEVIKLAEGLDSKPQPMEDVDDDFPL